MKRCAVMLSAVVLGITAATAFAFDHAPMCALPVAVDMALPGRAETGSICLWHPLSGSLRSSWPDACTPPQSDGSYPARLSTAEHAMEQARHWLDEGDHGQALLHLRVVASALPEVADHIAMLEGAAYEALEQPEQAVERYYRAAVDTPSADLRALARVGRARSLLAAMDPKAPKVVQDLLRRYPDLPEATDLRLAMGALREHQGRLASAVAIYRSLDLSTPGYPAAAEARARLAALKERKVFVPRYTPLQRVERAERLVKSGPVELARETVLALEDMPLAPDLKARVAAMAARMALVEGRFDQARTLAQKAPGTGTEPAPVEEEKRVRLRVRRLFRGRRPARVLPVHVVAALEIASRAGVTDLTDKLVAALAAKGKRKQAPPRVLFDGLVVAVGTATETRIVDLADTLVDNRAYAAAALYHRGRAYERGGQLDLAKEDFERVIEADRSSTHYYTNWANQRLRALNHEQVPQACYEHPDARCSPDGPEAGSRPAATRADIKKAIALLAPVADEHGDAYPWLPRALVLLQLGEVQRASDELHEAYLAWRGAVGRTPLRAGTDSVYRGKAVPRLPGGFPKRRARQKLNAKARGQLAAASSALGDYGTAVLLGGRRWASPLPRPFYKQVVAAAERHGIDPDLLWAVMRVESVFNNRIISYAGAVGLMQIMPRTGRLIANAQGYGHLTTTDLLRPEINVDFAAWYLSSLIERFDGRLPLAVASYNGGPHNVRKWIHRYGEHLPLDAFLERIPFTQTHRYVRRVLGYYSEYLAQHGEKLALLDLRLPDPRPDVVAF